MSDFIPFALPDIGEEEIQVVADAMRSGWLTTGPNAKAFEQEFAAYLGDDLQAIAVNSATAGLHLALEAIGVGPGDEVITTTHTFTASAEVARYLGAEPVLADIDPATLCISPAAIERAITPRTKAIIPVHYGGLSCDMDSILDIARRHGLRVIEDAAHALPASWQGVRIGALQSDLTVYSFYATKTLATGEGGMVVTRDPALAKRCRVMRLHGIDRDAFDRFTSNKPAWYYEIVAPGFKYNLTDTAAAMGRVQLRRVQAMRDRRAAIAAAYDQAFADLPLVLPPCPGRTPGVQSRPHRGDDEHAWHLYVIRLQPQAPLRRDDFIVRMTENGIGCSVHYVPLHLQPYWRDRYQLTPGMFPHSQAAFETMVSLPLYSRMSQAQVDKVIRTVRELLAQ
ncbi:DegT/DnrJ/EryC1/StrS family aminotransferase [Bordetella pseudohinzii]|uniref:UDP-4-amino-4, 6-dideoxy-N-acetyl-beta-L-altrosamine transaminase n=1 Tax=Bordetella pseudohinzii TaxID=1331258 RepID=A0A0J6CAA9_9BORD|nr:DegT/DnrJ/EryC1/StrS family aminotransferase [Bordetella pseudohinzii]ANY17997.1 UDP-4-amino-4,6-dideoxy-N-acetyl-beta-L-altrosamine transaminase [Bordetella pseudohinzii]KMM26347.1 pyridoxal phosphate-dependent aminotransferase [Bordetella pseudohinzii]KXA79572.1 UDP-4-amino-4,6-dideoxy-N-acetyl-beta-L-altrosamine transaminase [Bordetella pseudohinzii]KXA80849.1 UDP-4-amino-4,6-dideoxy-N-acetyl-beta-L-altrosamine transaminase [Bordetella pseudohinzii]CUI80802.1 UDP-4-amino-4-deoxy-L-arabin